ncbi:MAG: hypothetical protein ACE5G0_09310 [Rhodothermales bacterium]
MSLEDRPVVEPNDSAARRPLSYKWLFVSAVVVALALVSFSRFGARTPRPQEGAVYVRAGLDSTQVAPAVLSDTTASSSPVARRLVLDLLTRDLRVQVDHVGSCGDILDRYLRQNEGLVSTIADPLDREFRTVRPVLLAGRMMDECFSYTVTYDVPLKRPMRWKNSLLAQVPLRLSLIHPIGDFQHFRKEKPGA